MLKNNVLYNTWYYFLDSTITFKNYYITVGWYTFSDKMFVKLLVAGARAWNVMVEVIVSL